MKRSEFIAGFVHARKISYYADVQKGELRPSEAAMGLADAQADAIRAWGNLSNEIRRMTPAELFKKSHGRPDPGNPGNWTAERKAPKPAPALSPGLLAILSGALGHLEHYKATEEVDSLSAAESAIQLAIDSLPWLQAAPAGADVQSIAVKLRGDNDSLRSALASAADVLRVALGYHADEFDGPPDQDLNVSGADLVEWFSGWRIAARTSLATARRLIREDK